MSRVGDPSSQGGRRAGSPRWILDRNTAEAVRAGSSGLSTSAQMSSETLPLPSSGQRTRARCQVGSLLERNVPGVITPFCPEAQVSRLWVGQQAKRRGLWVWGPGVPQQSEALVAIEPMGKGEGGLGSAPLKSVAPGSRRVPGRKTSMRGSIAETSGTSSAGWARLEGPDQGGGPWGYKRKERLVPHGKQAWCTERGIS